MKIDYGTQAGIIFRATENDPLAYDFFFVRTNGVKAIYGFDISTGTDVKTGKAKAFQEPFEKEDAPSFKPQFGQWNTLGVIAVGSNIDLYINGEHLGGTQYPTLYIPPSTWNQIGLNTGDLKNTPNDVIFSGLEVWTGYKDS
jgi:hypothetical protein